jgi:hypothetical protein
MIITYYEFLHHIVFLLLYSSDWSDASLTELLLRCRLKGDGGLSPKVFGSLDLRLLLYRNVEELLPTFSFDSDSRGDLFHDLLEVEDVPWVVDSLRVCFLRKAELVATLSLVSNNNGDDDDDDDLFNGRFSVDFPLLAVFLL